MNRWGGTRRAVLTAVLAVVLVGELLVAAAFTATTSGRQTEPGSMSIAVVGGSVTAGGLNKVVWPTLLAKRTGWSVSNFALPGAGFVADGRGGHAYTYQVDRAQGAHPRIILIMTEQADNGLPTTGPIRVGALNAVNKVKLGGELALVIGPTWYERPVPDKVRRVSEAVQQVATEAGVPFLDALDPPWLTRGIMLADLSGPTDDGQSVIAAKVAAWLRTEVAGLAD